MLLAEYPRDKENKLNKQHAVRIALLSIIVMAGLLAISYTLITSTIKGSADKKRYFLMAEKNRKEIEELNTRLEEAIEIL